MNDHDRAALASTETEPAVEQLRERIGALELAAAKPEKPWYKQASNLITVLAVMAAFAAVFQTHLEQKNHELEDLQQSVVDIVENQKAISELSANPADAALSINIQGFLAEKGNALLSRGIELLNHHSGHLPPDIPYILGYQAASSGRYPEAERLYLRAISDADSPFTKFAPRQGLAGIYMLPGTPVFSISNGEKTYREALKSVAGSKDPSFIYAAGFLNENWAAGEFQAEDLSSGLGKLEAAEKLYQSLSLWNPNRFPALQRVRQSRSKMIQASIEGQKLAQRLSGRWAITGSSLGALPASGTLTVTLDQDSGLMTAYLVLKAVGPDSLGPKMQENGPVLIKDLHTAIFNWQGSDQYLGPLTGTTTLTFGDSPTSITAVEQQSNQSIAKYALIKSTSPPQ